MTDLYSLQLPQCKILSSKLKLVSSSTAIYVSSYNTKSVYHITVLMQSQGVLMQLY